VRAGTTTSQKSSLRPVDPLMRTSEKDVVVSEVRHPGVIDHELGSDLFGVATDRL
jgi:hypothetical protein